MWSIPRPPIQEVEVPSGVLEAASLVPLSFLRFSRAFWTAQFEGHEIGLVRGNFPDEPYWTYYVDRIWHSYGSSGLPSAWVVAPLRSKNEREDDSQVLDWLRSLNCLKPVPVAEECERLWRGWAEGKLLEAYVFDDWDCDARIYLDGRFVASIQSWWELGWPNLKGPAGT